MAHGSSLAPDVCAPLCPPAGGCPGGADEGGAEAGGAGGGDDGGDGDGGGDGGGGDDAEVDDGGGSAEPDGCGGRGARGTPDGPGCQALSRPRSISRRDSSSRAATSWALRGRSSGSRLIDASTNEANDGGSSTSSASGTWRPRLAAIKVCLEDEPA